MKTTTWHEDGELIQSIYNAVKNALEDEGITQHPGRAWVINQIKDAPDGDWGNESVRTENTKDITSEASTWAQLEEMEPERPERRLSIPQALASTSVGQAWVTVDKVKPIVEEVRALIWGGSDTPFSQTPEGHEEAVIWLRVQVKKNERKQAGRVKLEFAFEVGKMSGLANAYVKTYGKVRSGDAAYEDYPSLLIEAIKQQEGRLINVKMNGGYDSGFYRMLVKTDGDGHQRPFKVNDGTLSAQLAEQVERIKKLSGWWTDRETLDHIMCGSVPLPGVVASHQTTDTGPEAVKLHVRGPATVEEVARAYQEHLEQWELDPKPLTKNAGAVLQLAYTTPGQTWQQRLERWNEWRKEDKALRKYSDYTGLRRAYVNALERITWREKKKEKKELRSGEKPLSSKLAIEKHVKEIWRKEQEKWAEAERRLEAEASGTA